VIKRAFDIALAGLGLVVAAPLLAALAVAVRLAMGPPILFVQDRAGRHGRPFRLRKFRTMRPASHSGWDPASDEARLTPFGRWLRRWSLDELPQLWNVLKGEMSLVGPRPLPMAYLPRYSLEQARRHLVRPGITGLAQVSGRNAVTWPERFALDVWYVDHRSLALDLWILARTIRLALAGAGVSATDHATMEEFRGA
jgi:lipopolysaccharide/colanic/teichoic acid biosynthesis glycosyltransferase